MEDSVLFVEDKLYELRYERKDYALYFGYAGYALATDIWQKKTIYVEENTDILQNDLFAGEVGDIIFINEQPKMWANNGISLGDITKDGDEFDFSGIQGIQGWLTFEYRRLP